MGPRPDGRGTLIDLIFSSHSTLLQWGRDRMGAERGAGGRYDLGVGRASMGPRPDGRGTDRGSTSQQHPANCFNGAATGWPRNEDILVVLARALLASMGPRPDGRGTQCRPARPGHRRPASMGPRPDGRGTHVRGARSCCRVLLLQWGRDRMAAERARALSDFARASWLQWGRDRMAAERR